MFALVALFTIAGDFIVPIPCIVIFMPIVAVLTEIGGINPVHMGVVLIVTLAFWPDHPALRPGSIDGLEIHRRAVLAGIARLVVDLSRLLRNDRRLHFFCPTSSSGFPSTSSRSRSAASRTRAAPVISARKCIGLTLYEIAGACYGTECHRIGNPALRRIGMVVVAPLV
jgi:hypothetical protein